MILWNNVQPFDWPVDCTRWLSPIALAHAELAPTSAVLLGHRCDRGRSTGGVRAMITKYGGIAAATILALATGIGLGQAQTSDNSGTQAGVAQAERTGPLPDLARAVVHGDQETATRVLDKEPKAVDEAVRLGERGGFTPLILAAALSDTGMAKLLIQRGGGEQILAVDGYNRSALWYAAFNGDVELIKLLLNAPQDKEYLLKIVDVPDADFKRTPLHLAVRHNQPELVTLLLGAGATEQTKDVLGETPRGFCERNHTKACNAFQK